MKKFLEVLFSRALFLLIAFSLQIVTFLFIVFKFQGYFIYFQILSIALSVLITLYLISSNIKPEYKIAWIVPILIFPSFGFALYLLFSKPNVNKITKKKEREFYEEFLKNIDKFNIQDKKILSELKKTDIVARNQASYIVNHARYPIFNNYCAKYYSLGEEYFEALLEEIKNAQKFIFLEYFIIQEGKMWNSILSVLKEKAKNGLEVRVLFDDLGCIMKLPKGYEKTLEQYGIKCTVFNKVNFIFTILYNNRNHRKIAVIDGKIAFTGGINLADEYINENSKIGHWKDTGISIKGEGVWSFTEMFLINWNFINKTNEDIFKFKIDENLDEETKEKDGYIIPFADSPLDDEEVGENVYLNLIQSATKYIYINTPYLIVGSSIIEALSSAAKRGVDVRIVTPRIPDKKAVFEVTRSHYYALIESGVKIYEYVPGFIHAKSFVVDDKYSVIGTINLDYRSLYLHFECALWIYSSKVILDIKKDYLKTLELCEKYTLEDCEKISGIRNLYRTVLKVFSPLM